VRNFEVSEQVVLSEGTVRHSICLDEMANDYGISCKCECQNLNLKIVRK